jgi:uncharacterized protein YndB with AHSA1/START domain
MLQDNYVKIELEYPVNTSPKILFHFLSAPSGLTEWFCDDISVKDDVLTFFWDNEKRSARRVSNKANKSAMFRWLDRPVETFLEFRLETEDITRGVSLFITDFETQEDSESSRMLWDAQVNKLFQCIGA